ncbi:MAG: acetyl-CoA carboxylase, biotin carboxyl carrier protein [Thermomicrobia bacterium]|nr:acetyl-CoA carboxylase, biotin carboxyl carrier protein [Thermomicrobia bacterium]MCA1723795.1 acetyl-CoA carboxylase, biotin carboxyl carrier protein [Thermomicrobia bacterium]
MNDEREDERGLPTGLTNDIAALAAVMAEHGLGKIEVNANGVHLVLSAPRVQKNGATPVGIVAADKDEDAGDETPVASGYIVTSPMIGTYYSAPRPGDEPFVRVGDMVAAGQTVAIIEAMKIMNEIQAERGGIVEELLVSNGQPVEYSQPLMRLGQ